jgi:CheY-like chemotaxis protein
MARLTHGKVKLERHAVRLFDVLAQAIEATRNLLLAREQTLQQHFPAQPIWINADPLRLEQVFINLLSNAAKFGAMGDSLELRVALEEGLVSIRLRDHGQGISPDLLPNVFDLFTQEERTPDRQQGGLGIGLALARGLVELHGGTIEVASAGLGQGSEFVVRLPPALPPQEQLTSPPPVPAAARMRILIAEDNVDAADTCSLLLRKAGYTVQVARSGPEAVAVARMMRPHAVLLDIGLPGLDGFEVAHRLRSSGETADALIIGVSGYGDPDSRRKAHASGCNEYFVKPLDINAVLAALGERAQMDSR